MTMLRYVGLPLVLLMTFLPAAQAQESDDPIWTTQPTRIDRTKQTYERLPAKLVPRDQWGSEPQPFPDSKKHTPKYVTIHHAGVEYKPGTDPAKRPIREIVGVNPRLWAALDERRGSGQVFR